VDACNYLADGDDFLFFYFELRSVICASSVLPLFGQLYEVFCLCCQLQS